MLEQKLSESDLNFLYDVVTEVLIVNNVKNREYYVTYKSLQNFFNMLPDRIKFEAYEWTTSDTVFRDNACEWLMHNWDKVKGEL